MSERSNSHFYVGSLITSALGGLLIILFDFASWYNYDPRIYGWIGLNLENIGSTLLLWPIIILTSGCLFFCTYISFIGLKFPEDDVSPSLLHYSFIAAIVACVIILIGGFIFVVAMLMDEPTEWGFDVGFYGGLIGSALTIVLLYLAKSNQ